VTVWERYRIDARFISPVARPSSAVARVHGHLRRGWPLKGGPHSCLHRVYEARIMKREASDRSPMRVLDVDRDESRSLVSLGRKRAAPA